MENRDKLTISTILEDVFPSNGYFLSHLTEATPYVVYSEKDILGLISPTSSPETLNAYSDFSNCIHQIPKSKRFQFNDRLLAEEYSLLLNMKVLAKDKTGNQVRNSFPKGFQDNYKIYKGYREQYFNKLTKYNENYIQNKTDETWKKDTMPNLLLELDNLKAQWVTEGFKGQIEEVLKSKTVKESNLSILSLWDLWAGKFCEFLSMNSDLKGANSQYATFYAPFKNLLNEVNWQKAEYNHESIKQLLKSIPFKEKTQELDIYFNKIEKFSFDYQILRIERSWFEPKIFEAKFWKLNEQFNQEVVSDGKLSGTIPTYIEDVIFIRNFSKEIRKNLIEAGLEWIGSPFFNLLNKEIPKDENFYMVAVNCKVVPPCPNPDPQLIWR